MLERGFYLPPSQFEAAFLSLAHGEADVDGVAEAATEALALAMTSQPQRGGANLWVRVGELTSVAWEFLGSILAGALLGYFFDRHFEHLAVGLDRLTLLGTTVPAFIGWS